MTKFTFCIKFDLQMINDSPVITCTCGRTYEIDAKLFGKARTMFRCPHCNKNWHFDRSREQNTVLLIDPTINGSISLKKQGQEWVVNDDYYKSRFSEI